MSLRADKQKMVEEKFDGKEIELAKMPEEFSTCSIYDGGVVINKNVTIIVRHNDRYPEHNSTVFFKGKIPMVTNQTTSCLIKENTKLKIVPIKVVNLFCRNLDGKGTYKLPYMSSDSCFVPLEGGSRKEPDFINLALVDNFYKKDRYNSVVKFCDGLKVTLPIKYGHVVELADKYLKLYATYFSCGNSHQVGVFSKWEGSYYQEREASIEPDVKKALKKNAENIKIKSNFIHFSTVAEKQEIVDDLYENHPDF